MPPDIYNIDFTLSEEKLRLAAMGPDHSWADKTPQETEQRSEVEIDSDCDCDEDLFTETKTALALVNSHPCWESFKHNSDHIIAFLKGVAVQQALQGQGDVNESIEVVLGRLSIQGLPQLQTEVAEVRARGGQTLR